MQGKALSLRMRPAALISSRPLISSTPTFSRPTLGRSMSKTICAIADPMIARSTRWRASAPIVAPTSSTMLSPRMVGHMAAIAGRSTCAIVRRQNFAMAISAPVLPAETTTSASSFFTDSMARHMDDFHRPWRRAWLGLSSIRTATSACWKVETALSCGCWSSSGRQSDSWPWITNWLSGWRTRASAAPGMTTEGPWSPPIASRAIRTGLVMDVDSVLGHSEPGGAPAMEAGQ